MSRQPSLVNSEQAGKWLSQFAPGDRVLAKEMLEAFLLVSRDDFNDHLRALILERSKTASGVIGLYAERELGHRLGVPHRLFKESSRKPLRAEGSAGPPAVKATKAYDPSVGSEGMVARLITDLCREYPEKFVNHPGPDQIRRKRVRNFWLVTDLIGSGQRAHKYLQAAWLVRSVRSWWSGHFLKFAVVAYSSTDHGEKHVKRHPSKPEVIQVIPCPTIDTQFSKDRAKQMKRLCETYDPAPRYSSAAPWALSGRGLGYDGSGALLVFAHGAPNNVPLMFHKASRSKGEPWTPLFPSRVTAGIDSRVFGVGLTVEKIQKRLQKVGQVALARSAAIAASKLPTGEVFLVLGALSHPPRMNDRVLSRRTGMPSYRVTNLCRVMTIYGWLDSQRRLTDAGAGQLHHARKKVFDFWPQATTEIGEIKQMPYYPKSLRHPV